MKMITTTMHEVYYDHGPNAFDMELEPNTYWKLCLCEQDSSCAPEGGLTARERRLQIDARRDEISKMRDARRLRAERGY